MALEEHGKAQTESLKAAAMAARVAQYAKDQDFKNFINK